MSLIVIPLAGPDFVSQEFGIRPLFKVEDTTLIDYILAKRVWLNNDSQKNDVIFVLRDVGWQTEKVSSYLIDTFPLSKVVVLSSLTLGASFSVLSGVAMTNDLDQPVIVDLADIAFDITFNPKLYFDKNPSVDAVIPYFEADDPKFSYLRINGDNVLETKEKHVISSHASAGVYIFRNVASYLEAIMYSIKNREECAINDIFYICPSVNAFISAGKNVHGISVEKVVPLSVIFH
jgi:NDP-sugar pyrophosphorylase family protein